MSSGETNATLDTGLILIKNRLINIKLFYLKKIIRFKFSFCKQ